MEPGVILAGDGDVNGDGSITAQDAVDALDIAVRVFTPTPDEEWAADCNGDSDVTAADARGIMYAALGMGSCVDPIESGQDVPGTVSGSRAGSIWLTDASGEYGDTVYVDVNISNPDNAIDEFTVFMSFDPDMLTYESYEAGTLAPPWMMLNCNEYSSGYIAMGGFSVGSEVTTGSNGSLVRLEFTVSDTTGANGDTSDLVLGALYDDVTGFSTSDGEFTLVADSIWVENVTGGTGDSIDVDIMISNGITAIDSFRFFLTFDTSMLSFVSGSEGSLDPGWTSFQCTEPVSGQSQSTGFVSGGSIPVGSSGSLATLTFNVTCSSCTHGDTGALALTSLVYDLATFRPVDGEFTFDAGYTPTPTETPTPAGSSTPTPETSSTATPTPDPAATATPTPGETPTETPAATATPTATPETSVPAVTPHGLIILLITLGLLMGAGSMARHRRNY